MAIDGFEAVRKIHEGGQAIVYRARRTHDDLPVVLKVLRGPYPTPEALTLFRREAAITRAMQGPGIIGLLAEQFDAGQPFLVLEDFGGASLADHFAGAAAPLAVARLGAAVATALARVHAGLVIHKDISPANILWHPETDMVKLIDFGIASTVSRQRPALASPSILRGTLLYIAPEQTGRMNRTVDARADLYGLGATLYRLLTGGPPFDAEDPLALVHAHVARAPVDPQERVNTVPPHLAAIVMKLLAKTAEDRYQSAFGLAADLRRSAALLEAGTPSHAFALGRDDRPTRVQIPERLYGRAPEAARLEAAVRRCAAGERALVLVAGYSGVGKTALVHEVHRPMVESGGVFIAGKFDQYLRATPYASLAAAFGQFCLGVLVEGEAAILRWRSRMLAAVGGDGAVLIDVIPELALIIGPQPPAPTVPPNEAELRLHVVFQRFVRALAGADHPLVLFVDDLQWADLPTIRLFEVLASDGAVSHLLIIGAFRDNEVDAAHPLAHSLETLEGRGVTIERLTLAPLDRQAVRAFVADALRTEDAVALADLCFEKTAGNPFFLGQFLSSLEASGHLAFDGPAGRWRWDLAYLEGLGLTENVVDLLAARIQQVEAEGQRGLCTAAVVGAQFDLEALAQVMGSTPDQLEGALRPALEEGLIMRLEGELTAAPRYAFGHDRIQQAAYGLLSADARAEIHERIGWMLVERTPRIEDDDGIFDAAAHLNAAADRLAPPDRLWLARLDLAAGRRARAAAAFGAAHDFVQAGLELLGDDPFSADYALACDLQLEAATAAYLTRQFDDAHRAVDAVLARAKAPLHRVRALEVRIAAQIAQNEQHAAIRSGLAALAILGITLPEAPKPADIQSAMEACGALLAQTDLAALGAGPAATDTLSQEATRLLMNLTPPAYIVAPMLMPLIATSIIRLSSEVGLTPESGYGFALYGLVLCSVGALQPGYDLARFGCGLTARFPDHRRESVRAHHVFYGFARHWIEPLRDTLPPYAELFQEATAASDFEYAGFCAMLYSMNAFHSGRPLDMLEPEMQRYTEAMHAFRQEVSLALHGITHQAAINLLEDPADPLVLSGRAFDETRMIPMFEAIGDPTCLFVSHLFKGILAFTLGAYDRAWAPIVVAMSHEPSGATATFHRTRLFTLHALLALWRGHAEDDPALRDAAEASRAKIVTWAAVNPANLDHAAALLAAEWARLDGDRLEAMDRFDEAIARAREAGFLSDEGLANELAARFYLAEGRTTAARAYLMEARFAYQRWGAVAKVRQLDAAYPELLAALPGIAGGTHTGSTTGTVTGDLDIEAVIRASQAISQEIVLADLVRTLVTIALEASSARKAVLLLPRDGTLVVAAVGQADAEVYIEVPEGPQSRPLSESVPETVIGYVQRTEREVLLDDAQAEGLFTADPYIRQHAVRSILALPVTHHGDLRGLLYLENDRTARVFTGERLELAKVLLAQAAISLENATLYESLEEKVRARTWELELARNEAERAHRRSDAILFNVLPRPIAEELKQHGAARPVQVDAASVMFTDFVGFTAMASHLSPAELLHELERCFTAFDEIMDRFGVEKLKTIGDAYMAAAGIPQPSATHVVDLLRAGLAVVDYIDARAQAQDGLGFTLRIGVNTGPLVAGVIGRRRFAYDVWGDTVNTASRVETSGEPGRVNITEATWQTARHLFTCAPRGPIEVKGKGPVAMYFVDGILPDLSVDEDGRSPNDAFWEIVGRVTG